MNYVVAIVGLLVGAQGFWSLLQAWLNRDGQKAEISRQEAKTEIDKETIRIAADTAETTRLKLLAESQLEAQQAALESWQNSYGRLHDDYKECENKYDKCHDEMVVVHDAATLVVDVFATFVAKMRAAADEASGIITIRVTGDEFLELRRAISDARLKLR